MDPIEDGLPAPPLHRTLYILWGRHGNVIEITKLLLSYEQAETSTLSDPSTLRRQLVAIVRADYQQESYLEPL
jgi:hypothetical protein